MAGADGSADIVGEVQITFVAPCLADPAKIRLKASVQGNLAEVMPYLNAQVKSARYNRNIPSISFGREWRGVNLFAREVTITKALNMTDAWDTIAWVKSLVNETWADRANIQPDHTMRVKPDPLSVYKRLPRTNCKACGWATCLAFAAKLVAGEARLAQCGPLSSRENAEAAAALAELLGDELPGVSTG